MHESGKLKDKKIKDFLKNYYDGDPSIDCPKGCKGNCPMECYVEIHQSLVNDDGKQVDFNKVYTRDGQLHCCGSRMKKLSGKNFCTVCGNETK